MSRTPRTNRAAASTPQPDPEQLRRIPSVEKLLSSDAFAPLISEWGRGEVKRHLASELDRLRANPAMIPREDGIAPLVGASLAEGAARSLRPVINASGVIIHTNLGRSPIHPEILARASGLLSGYTNLELDLESGRRGRRDDHLAELATALFGCEAALLVNNNASAVLLLLAATARGKEVVVSRGELVEIGGSFRVPEVIVQGGAILREVGTTNRTRARDYTGAAGEETAAFLRVHRSNFEIVGFTESPSIEELVAEAGRSGAPLFYDEGSGRVVSLAQYGFTAGETLRQLLEAGVDVITCSTDKLIGATQGGLILGRREVVDACARHPLMRALRAGKESYAIVAETLRTFLAGKQEELVPVYAMLAADPDFLRRRGEAIAAALGGRVIETRAALGGGTTPTETIRSWGVALAPPGGAEQLRSALLAAPGPILSRIEEDELVLDLRTIFPGQDEAVIRTAATALESLQP